MSGRLGGKRCLIVGGTSGIGQAAAERFQAEGARLVVAGNFLAEGQAIPAELAQFVHADATQPTEVDILLRTTLDQLGGLDILFHVAGGSGRRFGDGPLHECSDDGWSSTLNLNLTCTFLTNRAAVRHFLAAKQPGVILNMASMLALSPSPRHFDTSAYAAAKGGVLALSRYAAARYAADGIRVNVLAPGLIDTPMAARAIGDEAIRAYLRTKQPLAAGPALPVDCAEAAVFLCSDEARFLTGVVLPVDGGWSVSEGQAGRDDGPAVG
jgi:NAD(P)-dependent dehydrogenase (short-subunit alcohol dehydrogenase family)